MSETISREEFLGAVTFNADGLVPVIAQDHKTGGADARLDEPRDAGRNAETGHVTYWSRSRDEVWRKGATSGHTQRLVEAWIDCDGDTLLFKVDQTGPACHTGAPTCFFRKLG